jgi:hypothetical protein
MEMEFSFSFPSSTIHPSHFVDSQNHEGYFSAAMAYQGKESLLFGAAASGWCEGRKRRVDR